MKVKDLDKYYEKLNIGISMSKMWNTLQSKAEYGSDKSEKGYQQVAKTMAGNIARGLGGNADLAEILTMCQGSYFPAYGEKGKAVIMQYLEEHGLPITESELARKYIEYDLAQSGNIITTEFDELLKELFDRGQATKTQEVQIARICEQTIADIKKIEQLSTMNQVDLLYRVSKDVEQCSIEAGVPKQSQKVKEMLKLLPETQIELGEKEKQKIYADLDSFMNFAGENKWEGIYEYIGTDELQI